MIPLLILRSHLCCSCIEVGIFKLRTFGVSSIISCPVLSQCKPFPRIKSLIALLWYGRTPEVASRRCCGVNAVHVRGRSSVSREPRELGREPREHTDHLGPPRFTPTTLAADVVWLPSFQNRSWELHKKFCKPLQPRASFEGPEVCILEFKQTSN
jgi:hypothetical protein